MTMYTGRSPNASTPTIINGRGLKKRKLSHSERVDLAVNLVEGAVLLHPSIGQAVAT
jgi:hypothetical protein